MIPPETSGCRHRGRRLARWRRGGLGSRGGAPQDALTRSCARLAALSRVQGGLTACALVIGVAGLFTAGTISVIDVVEFFTTGTHQPQLQKCGLVSS